MPQISSGSSPSDHSSRSTCSYFGREVYEDIFRCPYCGNYDDGKGPIAAKEKKQLWNINRYEWIVLILLFSIPVLAGIIAILQYVFKMS